MRVRNAGDQPQPEGRLGIDAATVTEWLRAEGEANDVVMSSRVRLARNVAGFPFVNRASTSQRREVLDLCFDRLRIGDASGGLRWVELHVLPPLDRTLLAERHLISNQHAKGRPPSGAPSGATASDPRAVAFSARDERLSIMFNEEDHLRIQSIRAGLALTDAWKEIDRIDDAVEGSVDYAYSPRFGYLTACPTNVGTGVRMSVMLHLPALKLTGDIDKVKRAATDMNLAVRGFYGEGSDAAGDFYQISNQTTLGKSETVILHELEREIIPEVVEYERAARQSLMAKRGLALADQVHRAHGLLSHARLVATEEAMQMLSHLRLGVLLGLVKGPTTQLVNHLMLLVQPAHLQRLARREIDQEQRRVARAAMLHERLRMARE